MTKIGLAAALLVAAGGIYFVLKPSEDVLDDFSESAHYHCSKCDTGFDVPENAPEGTFMDIRKETPDDGTPRRRQRGLMQTERVAKCPTCGEYTGHLGRLCGGCNASFRTTNAKGEAMICPKCKWDPLTGQEAVGDRLYILEEDD